MSTVFLVFPHQLFKDCALLSRAEEVYLVEEYLFFSQYKFHKQKLLLHRASMKFYEGYLRQQKINVHYVEATDVLHDVRALTGHLAQKQVQAISYYDVCDDWLDKRIREACSRAKIRIEKHESPLFINSTNELDAYFKDRKRYFQTDFYIQQRKKLGILLDPDQKPAGGKWSFDAENRLKYPAQKTPPRVTHPPVSAAYAEAMEYVEKHFPDNYGSLSKEFSYPSTYAESEAWLQDFLEHRFAEFGLYEDAIVDRESILHHSVLTPMLNIGLLSPQQVIEAALEYGRKKEIPVNSVEGFIRQIIGWREYIRAVYVYKGTEERTRNYWQFSHKMPDSFYRGTTGIQPVDDVIKKVLATGYCHHIERLMLLGNFMLLCELHPDQVYQWFMEMFIDAYDWVMVPNVYGMSQFADGGLMATKPYISGSSYVLKMSNYKKGDWCEKWDALFWGFMNKQRHFFLSNPRLGMLIKTYDKMSEEKKKALALSRNKVFSSLYS